MESGIRDLMKDCDNLVANYASKKTEKKMQRFSEQTKCARQYKGKMAVQISPITLSATNVKTAFRVATKAIKMKAKKKNHQAISAKLTQHYTKRLAVDYAARIADA